MRVGNSRCWIFCLWSFKSLVLIPTITETVTVFFDILKVYGVLWFTACSMYFNSVNPLYESLSQTDHFKTHKAIYYLYYCSIGLSVTQTVELAVLLEYYLLCMFYYFLIWAHLSLCTGVSLWKLHNKALSVPNFCMCTRRTCPFNTECVLQGHYWLIQHSYSY